MLKKLLTISRKFVFLLLAIPANYLRERTNNLLLAILVFAIPIIAYYSITFFMEYKKSKNSCEKW